MSTSTRLNLHVQNTFSKCPRRLCTRRYTALFVHTRSTNTGALNNNLRAHKCTRTWIRWSRKSVGFMMRRPEASSEHGVCKYRGWSQLVQSPQPRLVNHRRRPDSFVQITSVLVVHERCYRLISLYIYVISGTIGWIFLLLYLIISTLNLCRGTYMPDVIVLIVSQV